MNPLPPKVIRVPGGDDQAQHVPEFIIINCRDNAKPLGIHMETRR